MSAIILRSQPRIGAIRNGRHNTNAQRMYHWYCLTFQGLNDKGNTVMSADYWGVGTQQVTQRCIEAARLNCGLNPGTSVLMSVSYLGYMTRQLLNFKGNLDVLLPK